MNDTFDNELPLSDRQRRFVDEYMSDMSDREGAFIRAGYKIKDKARIGVRVARLLRSPAVRDELRRRQDVLALAIRSASPLVVVLDNGDSWYTIAQAPLPDDWSPEVRIAQVMSRVRARQQAQSVAREAAPYIHPRLQAIAVNMAPLDPASQEPINIKSLTTDQIRDLVSRMERDLRLTSG